MSKAIDLIELIEVAQVSRVGKLANKITKKDGDNITVRYHYTNVVEVTKDKITLNTDGWFTPTTKARMNQASNQYNLGYQVYQKKGNWFVDYKGKTIPFESDTLILER